MFAPAIVAAIADEAPRVRLHFTPKPDKDTAPQQSGRHDLANHFGQLLMSMEQFQTEIGEHTGFRSTMAS